MRGNLEEKNKAPGRSAAGSRLLSVQALRACGALLVVWFHSIQAAETFTATRQANFFHLKFFGACGVDIFFAISGFIVSLVAVRSATQRAKNSPRAAIGFLSRRITRIFPLYWILTSVIILGQQLGQHPVNWASIYWMPTLLLTPSFPSAAYPVNDPLLSLGWSLMFEMYFYLILTIFIAWTPRSVVRNAVIFLCGMVAVGMLIGIHRPLLVLWMNPMVLEFVFGCLIGVIFSSARFFGRSFPHFGAWLGAAGAVLLAATIFTGFGDVGDSDWIMRGYYSWLRVGVWGVPSALLVAGVIFWSPAMRSLPARLLVFLGDASYSIYLSTIPARSVVEHFWRFFRIFGADTGVLLAAVFCTAVGVICYLLIERPLMKVFHNWYKPIPFHPATT